MLQLRLPVLTARVWPAASAALLWALAAGSVVFWWLHSPRQELDVSSPVRETPAASSAQSSAAVARALGQSTTSLAAPDAQRRFQLLGVIAADSGHGSALLMVDGQPARAFVQGQTVVDSWHLRTLSPEGVLLGSDGAQIQINLPSLVR